MQAIIMAGGKGRRLRPYTAILPKPLMPIGDIPVLEIIIRQLKFYGVSKVILAVGYLAELLQAYFGDGKRWGLEITYSKEEMNMGTIGPLTLIEDLEDDFFVMNGDILTDLDFKDFFEVHKQNNNLVTIATYKKVVKIDLGVLETDENQKLKKYIEKPILDYQVSMGIYSMKKEILEYIPRNECFDIPDLMWKLLELEKRPNIYLFNGQWLDIGRKEDYDRAVIDFNANISSFLPE